MSSHTCYRTSRSAHFPFWAVCSLSGTQPELSLGRLHPHVERDALSLFAASSQFNVLRASTRVRRPPGPTWPGCTRAEAAPKIGQLKATGMRKARAAGVWGSWIAASPGPPVGPFAAVCAWRVPILHMPGDQQSDKSEPELPLAAQCVSPSFPPRLRGFRSAGGRTSSLRSSSATCACTILATRNVQTAACDGHHATRTSRERAGQPCIVSDLRR
jgi:hypothetical protein